MLTGLPMSPESNADVPRTNYSQFKLTQRGSWSRGDAQYLTHSLSFVSPCVGLFPSRMWICL